MSPPDSDRDVPPPASDLASLDHASSTALDELAVRVDGDDIHVAGVLDAANSNLLLASIEYLQSVGRTDIRVDLAGVNWIGNQAIRMLFDRQNALHDTGGELRLFVADTLRPRLALCRLEPGPIRLGRCVSGDAARRDRRAAWPNLL